MSKFPVTSVQDCENDLIKWSKNNGDMLSFILIGVLKSVLKSYSEYENPLQDMKNYVQAYERIKSKEMQEIRAYAHSLKEGK